jgi:hypothetical protein
MGKGSFLYNLKTLGLAKHLTLDEEKNKKIRAVKGTQIGSFVGTLATGIFVAYLAISGYKENVAQYEANEDRKADSINAVITAPKTADISKTYFAPWTTKTDTAYLKQTKR